VIGIEIAGNGRLMDDHKKDSKNSTQVNGQTDAVRSSENNQAMPAKKYFFGGIKEFNLEQIETEVLNESIYLDVFAGSDLSLKKEVEATAPALEAICRLDTIKYRWNENASAVNQLDQSIQLGVVAQQVATEFPELVRRDAETGYLAVNYQKLSVHLISAIKELNGKIELQNKRISDLELATRGH